VSLPKIGATFLFDTWFFFCTVFKYRLNAFIALVAKR
jgi:hypothetical protein